jgi:DNA repair exonuclease SbcCD ATPase subunit
VDDETAGFLREKAKKILDVRMKSILSIGKELKTAQEKLASHDKNQGTFISWCQGIGLKKHTVYNYIRSYEYVVENFDNISDPEKIQQSLLFAISKPSAPEELQQAVLDGDITTHKQYQEALEAMKNAEQEKEEANKRAEEAIQKANEYQRLLDQKDSLLKNSQKAIDDEKEKVRKVESEFKKAQAAGDLKKVKDLQYELDDKNKAVLSLQNQLDSLEEEKKQLQEQLKEQPIPTTAVQIVEKADSGILEVIYDRMIASLKSVKQITPGEKEACCKLVYEKREGVIDYIDEAMEFLETFKKQLILVSTSECNSAQEQVEPLKCENCQYVDYEDLKEVDEDNGFIFCKRNQPKRLWRNDNPCKFHKPL